MRPNWQAPGSDEVALSGVRAEFRTALRHEIDAARRQASSSAVALVRGRRIAQVGAAYQYVFTLGNALNLPDDAPGELRVDDRAPLDVAVVSVDGLTVTLSVPEDLGPFVPTARLVTDLTFLMRRLIARIEALGDAPNRVGERVRGALPVSGTPSEDHMADDLNPQQQAAVASCLGRDTTFIWGPPGTGKTTTIGAIGRALYSRERSVLLVSHTNTAVDQATYRIAKALDPAGLAQGRLVRVGPPRDPRLAEEVPDALLTTHVERRSRELAARRELLLGEREALADEVVRVARLIDIREWLDDAGEDLATMSRQLDELHALEADLDDLERAEQERATNEEWWEGALDAAEEAGQWEAGLAAMDARAGDLRSALEGRRACLGQLERHVLDARNLLERAAAAAPLREKASSLPSLQEQADEVESAHRLLTMLRGEEAAAHDSLAQAEALLAEASSRGRLARLWRQLPDPEAQQRVVRQRRDAHAQAVVRREQAENDLVSAQELRTQIAALVEQLREYSDVPEVDEQAAVVEELQGQVASLSEEARQERAELAALQAQVDAVRGQLHSFAQTYGSSAGQVREDARARLAELTQARARTQEMSRRRAEGRRRLGEVLAARLRVLQEWDLAPEADSSAESMLEALRSACTAAEEELNGRSLPDLQAGRDKANGRIRSIDAEVQQIEESLTRVEETVIAEARVVATTLTRAYLRDPIQQRRFDTVILDEASIAPIPALWIAASLADRSAVVVGDPEQLPPIVVSEHELAQKWLGRDIFDHACPIDGQPRPQHLVPLEWQYRMHPQISAIPNALIYGGSLVDQEECLCDGDLYDWYCGRSDAVLLVDTGPVGAWVTSVPRGRTASRLNFLSATICVDLARRMLRAERQPKKPGDAHRALIVCPYRAHMNLLQVLLREQGLEQEVLPGTAHHFQGSEAGVVILDLVNDEPHWRVAMFDPKKDPSTRRLLNVALTRAQRRLVVVGDFDYIMKSAKRSFLGARLLPFLLQHYPRVSALDLVPVGLSARAAAGQRIVFGGDVEPPSTRCVVGQDDFYHLLHGDLARAQNRVVIYSAFITQTRMTHLQPSLQAAVQRGVEVYVVTKDLKERRSHSAEYRYLEQALRSWGAVVVHKRGMHEKLVFVDDEVVWVGSLNPLSHSDTQEIMERRASRQVVADFARALRLDELVGEFREGMPTCPSGHELVADEGRGEPFYWRCVQDGCYSRSIGEPRPLDGMVWCSHPGCAGPVEYGEWGGRPCWRCVRERRHHRKIMPSHLRLPKMRELVPGRELRRLDRQFGIKVNQAPADHPQSPSLWDATAEEGTAPD